MTTARLVWRRLALAVAALAVSVSVAFGQTPLPTLKAPVNDFANVVDQASATELDRVIRVLQAATGDAVVVATIDTFAPYGSIEEYAVKLFERAGVGTRKSDNGVLILVAVRDRRVRIEVGYGLEEFITDGFAGETIRRDMLPAFRDGRYGPGLVAGATRVIQRIAQGRGVTLDNVALPASQPSGRNSDPPLWFFILIILFIVMMNRFGGRGGIMPYNRRGRGTWSGWHGGIGGFGGGFGGGGGGGFGGFGGFGGGRSGGGGASGGW